MRTQSKRMPMKEMKDKLKTITKKSGKKHFVYSLECPIDRKVRWIGLSGSLANRFQAHWYYEDRNNILKWGWILALKKFNMFTIMVMLGDFNSKTEALNYETEMIRYYSRTNFNKNGQITD